MNVEMNKKYDAKFKEVPFYKIHPEYIPFVGNEYDTYRILLIGESHYIEQKNDENPKYDLDYFREHWWNGTDNELQKEYSDWYNTKAVVKNYLNGKRTRSHLIFSNPLKVFSKDILGKPIEKINSENVQQFNCFAFMNFFQMPSLYEGMKFWDSLRKSGETNRHCPMWDECVTKSSEVLDKVIDILEPKLVVFLSASAYNAFKKSNARHAGDEIIQQTVHPCSPWWYKKNKDGRNGKELFSDILNSYKNSYKL